MNFVKMFEMQRELDSFISEKNPLQEGESRIPEKILATVVELCEMTNEARFFKYWSDNQSPTEERHEVCGKCKAQTNHTTQNDCVECEGTGVVIKNPLLEEYVDGVHFFLSLAIEKGWEKSLREDRSLCKVARKGSNENLTKMMNDTIYLLLKSHMESDPTDEKYAGRQATEFYFRLAWRNFFAIGIGGFGFTVKQIQAAYTQKHAENIRRQEVGY